MANGIKSLLTNIQDISTVPTNLIGGMFGNPFNPTQPIQAVLTQNQRDYLTQKALEKGGESGLLSYDDYGTNLKLSDIVTQPFTNPTGFSTALTAGSVSYKRNPDTGEIELNPASLTYDFGGGSKALDFIDQGGLMGKAYNVGERIGDFFFAPAGAAEVTPQINTGITSGRDFSDFDKARMGGLDTLRGNNLFSKVDARTADEEAALLDDAFEQQLAEATRTGGLGPLEGIIQNLNPKDAVSFVTSLLTGGASTALSGVASLADKLGIRRGMQEPRGAVGKGGYGVSRPGNTLTNQTRANRAQFSDFYSNFQGGAQQQMGKRVDDVINRTVSGRRTRSDASDFVDKYGSKEQKSRFAGIQRDKENVKQNPFDTTEGQGGGGGKVVCTMMNKSYGFGSFRNKIWMKFHKDLSPEYQKGYHKIFLPLVKVAKKNKIVKKILEHIAVHSTIDMRQSMRGKKHLLGRLYRKIILPICYWAGKK
tara:strand:- start:39 stop:1475 length:1437 start_codon:yes stop_codon:yes gene_type:complete